MLLQSTHSATYMIVVSCMYFLGVVYFFFLQFCDEVAEVVSTHKYI
jgi:hypothetical protein